MASADLSIGIYRDLSIPESIHMKCSILTKQRKNIRSLFPIGLLRRTGCEKSRFSINISLYLENDTRYARRYTVEDE